MLQIRFISGLALGLFALLAFSLPLTPAQACTTFTLQDGDDLYFVHSLNQGSVPRVDGAVFINPRDTWKNGHSWASLLDGDDSSGAGLVWKSLYGSVTFSPLGLEFPDGGMNEAGLFIWEMGFDPEYSTDESLPVLFQMQWMQYQLDNFATVPEVIEYLDRVALDGWGWHYMVADKQGRAAIIDFVDGHPVVTTGDALPIHLCCNSDYSVAMDWLKKHQGFGGDLPIEQRFSEIPRFIYGAKLMQEFKDQDPVEYCFKILDDMSVNVRWSIVFDVSRGEAYFKTNLDGGIRHFAFVPADFEPARGPLMLDINSPGPADVRSRFVAHDSSWNAALLASILHHFMDEEADVEVLARSMTEKIRYGTDAMVPDSVGHWAGVMKVPAKGDWMDLTMDLSLERHGELTGKISIEGMMAEARLSNLDETAGLLSFTAAMPESGDLVQFKLFMTADGIRGGAGTWDWDNRKTAFITLHKLP